jgi:hypothetical protein
MTNRPTTRSGETSVYLRATPGLHESNDPAREVHAMTQIIRSFKHVRYAVGSLTAVLFAACVGGS